MQTIKQTVSSIILAQLGGRGRVQAMTGAKQFMSGNGSLAFRIGNNPEGVTNIEIILRANDTYDVIATAVRGFKVKDKGVLTGVYSDRLKSAVTSLTGLELTL